jgi:hypothetical protein
LSKLFWDHRYSKEDFAYGDNPNTFLVTTLPSYTPGKILFPAEGEGRNAVYAASLGWDTVAFDISSVGRLKAEMLYTIDEITTTFTDLETKYLEQVVIDLHEGIYHNGTGSVIRYIGIKKEKPSK